ncbi:hypothetical protein [Pedobacter sp.]|uniref:hypothetical protein n=1 Tax=Pedobacter sp. TaxID=1411316 RepID=UPI0031CE8404
MFAELNKYKEKGIFVFNQKDRLSSVCNAPKSGSGIYLIYATVKGKRELIYIGISGRKSEKGEIIHRKDGLRGRFLRGKTDGVLRKIAWPNRMLAQQIKVIEIRWYVTYGELDQDFPRDLEVSLLSQYQLQHGRLPIWNKKI